MLYIYFTNIFHKFHITAYEEFYEVYGVYLYLWACYAISLVGTYPPFSQLLDNEHMILGSMVPRSPLLLLTRRVSGWTLNINKIKPSSHIFEINVRIFTHKPYFFFFEFRKNHWKLGWAFALYHLLPVLYSGLYRWTSLQYISNSNSCFFICVCMIKIELPMFHRLLQYT